MVLSGNAEDKKIKMEDINMKKVCKVLALLLAVIMVISMLAACGNSKAPGTNDETSKPSNTNNVTPSDDEKAPDNSEPAGLVPEEGAALTLWMDNDEYNEKIVDLWSAKYPNVPLTVVNVGTTDARQKNELDGPTGTGADVFVMAHDGVAVSAQAGTILEIDLLSDEVRRSFVQNAIDAVSYSGKIYAFPLSMKTIVMFYNKNLVETPADTWAEMKAFAKEYNDPAQNKFACIWQAVEPYYAHGFLGGYGYDLFGTTHDDPSQLGWDSKEAAEGLAFYKTLHDEIYPVASADATWDAMNSMFSAGECPYVITGPWSIADFTKAGVDFGIAPLPKMDNGERPKTLSTVDTVCVSAFTKYPVASMLLAQFVATDPDCLKLLYETKNELSASIEGQKLDFYVNDPYMSSIAVAVNDALPQPYIPEMANVWAPYQKAIIAVWDDLQTPEEALAAAQNEFYSSIAAAK